MKTSLLARGLLAVGTTLLLLVGLGSLLGCGVTLSELQARNSNAKTLRVHCRPWKMDKKATILAMRSSGDYLHTDETPSATRVCQRSGRIHCDRRGSDLKALAVI